MALQLVSPDDEPDKDPECPSPPTRKQSLAEHLHYNWTPEIGGLKEKRDRRMKILEEEKAKQKG